MLNKHTTLRRNIQYIVLSLASLGIIQFGMCKLADRLDKNCQNLERSIEGMPSTSTKMVRGDGTPWLVDFEGEGKTIEQVIYPNKCLFSSRANRYEGGVVIKNYSPAEIKSMTFNEQKSFNKIYQELQK